VGAVPYPSSFLQNTKQVQLHILEQSKLVDKATHTALFLRIPGHTPENCRSKSYTLPP